MTLMGSFQLRVFHDSMSPVNTSSEPNSAQTHWTPLLLTLQKAKLLLPFVRLKATRVPWEKQLSHTQLHRLFHWGMEDYCKAIALVCPCCQQACSSARAMSPLTFSLSSFGYLCTCRCSWASLNSQAVSTLFSTVLTLSPYHCPLYLLIYFK